MSKARKSRPRHAADRPMALAVVLATLSVLGVSMAYFIASYSIPNSPIRLFFDLMLYNNSATLPGTALYQQLSAGVDRQMALFADPIAYLTGGIVLGKTISRRYAQPKVLLAAGVMAFSLELLTLVSLWAPRLASQSGHLLPGQVDSKLALMQTVLTVFWVGVCVIGAEIGLRWRYAAQSRTEAKSPSASVAR